MVEESHAGERHSDTAFVALVDNEVVSYRSTRLSDIANTRSVSALDVVRKREECIGRESDVLKSSKPFVSLFSGNGSGPLGKVVLPDTVSADILFAAVDVAIDHIVAVRTAQVGTELEVQRLGVLTQEPGIGLGTCQAGAVDTALLTGTDTNSLSVISETNRVRLGVLQGNQRYDQVDLSILGQFLILRNDIRL